MACYGFFQEEERRVDEIGKGIESCERDKLVGHVTI